MPQNSPLASAGRAIFDYLQDREVRQRQDMLDSIVAKREERLGEAADANRDLAREQLDMTRETRGLQNAAARQDAGAKMAQQVGISDVTAPQAAILEAGGQRVERVLPSTSRAFMSALPQGPASPTPDAAPPIAPGIIAQGPRTERTGMHFGGTAQQQAIAGLNIPEDAKQLAQSGLVDGNALVNLLKGPDQVNGQRTEAINPTTGKNEIVLVNPQTGKATWTGLEPPPNASGTGANTRPYTLVVPTAQGTLLVDGRDPSRILGQFDAKPGEGAQDDITRGQVINEIITNIERDFKPERVGPIMGRFKTMEDMFLGVENDPGLAGFRADVAMLRNMVINLRTGAAMSEPEAKRIFEEVINVNLPPSTFMERLQRAKVNYTDYLTKRSRLAFGRTTGQDVDQITGTQRPAAGGAPQPAPGVVAPAPKPAPAAPSKYKIVERR